MTLWNRLIRLTSYVRLGRTDDALDQLEQLLASPEELNDRSSILACAYFVLGQTDEGFAWLRKSMDAHEMVTGQIVPYLACVHRLDDVSQDPRLAAALEEMGLPPVAAYLI